MRAIILTILAAVTVFAASPLRAADIPVPQRQTVIHMTQQAEKLVRRDRLRIELRAEASGPDRKQVQGDINRRMATALKSAKQASSVSAATGTYTMYEPGDPKGLQIWRGSQMLSLTSGDFDAVLDLAGTLQADGLVISGMHFFVAAETMRSVQDDLTSQALRAVRDRAGKVAADLGMSVDHYGDITIGNAGEEGGAPVPRMMAMSAMAAKLPPPVGEAGDATLSVAVSADIVLGAPPANR